MSPITGLVPDAFTSGRSALATGVDRLDRAAARIATPDPPDLAGPLVEADQAALLARAAVEVIRTADSLLGTLLDTHA
jgi:hypothetical protein